MGYIGPYYWVDDHPLLYGNNGSLDPSTAHTYTSSGRNVPFWELSYISCIWHLFGPFEDDDNVHFLFGGI